MPKKLDVLYNPENPNEAQVALTKRIYLQVIIAFILAIILMIIFLINTLSNNTNKIYSYRVICNYKGYIYNQIEERETKTKEEALNQIKDKYKNWQITCEYEEINV